MKPLVKFERTEFINERWRYRAGEHVTFIAPTQHGKTTLAFQLMEVTATPRMPAITKVMKPRDRTVSDWGKRLRYRTVRQWPPFPSLWRPKPNGYLLWPRHTFNFNIDKAELTYQMERCLTHSYRKGNRIVFGDEAYGLAEELGLGHELVAIWTRGASMGCGLWAATQRPAYIPLWGYSMAEHVFIGHDPDKRSVKRFAEIGGIDPDIIQYTVPRLQRYEYLYIRRTGPAICIVGA